MGGVVGRHQRRRRRGRGRAADRGRPRPATSATRPPQIALEKAGIIKPGATAVHRRADARGRRGAARRAAEVGATVVREGVDFGVVSRVAAVGGQMVSLQGLRAPLRRRLPAAVRRPPGAERRRSRSPPSRRSSATQPLDEELVSGGVRPGHLARPAGGRSGAARRSCSTPPTTRTAPRPRRPRSRTPSRSTRSSACIGVMADKDHEGVLAAFEPHLAHVVCTQNSTDRAMPAERAGRTSRARSTARTGSPSCRGSPTPSTRPRRSPRPARRGSSLGSGAVLVTGSVVTVGEARTMLQGRRMSTTARAPALAAPRHVRRRPGPRGDRRRAVDAGDDHARPTCRSAPRSASASASRSPACCSPACSAPSGPTSLGWVLQVAAIGLGFVVPMMFVLGAALRAAVGRRRTSSVARSSASGPRRTPRTRPATTGTRLIAGVPALTPGRALGPQRGQVEHRAEHAERAGERPSRPGCWWPRRAGRAAGRRPRTREEDHRVHRQHGRPVAGLRLAVEQRVVHRAAGAVERRR